MLLSRITLLPIGPAALLPALAGFLLTLQTVLILRPGTLGGVSWPLATIGVYASDVVLLITAAVGVTKIFSPLPFGRGSDASREARRAEWERGWGSRHRPLTTLALLAAVAIVNTWVSADPWLSAVGWLRIIAFILALVGLPSWPVPMRRAFLGGFLVAMLGHIVLGFVQFLTLEAQPSTLLGIAAHNAWMLGDSVITAPGERWLRAYGGFPHPNVFGTALLVALVAVVAAGQGGSRATGLPTPPNPPSPREGGEQQKPISPPHTGRGSARGWGLIIHHSSFIILTFALVLSFSRSAWLGFIILLIVMAWRRGAPKKHGRVKLEQAGDVGAPRWSVRLLAGIGAIAFVAFLIALWPLIVPRFTGSTPNEQRSLSERTVGIEAAIAFGSIPPFFLGVGLHAMPKVLWEFRPMQYERKVRQELRLQQYGRGHAPWDVARPTHNVPLLAIAEIGPIGVLVLILVLVLLFRSQRPYALRLTPYSSMWLALAPSLLFDHHLWSLPIGLALLFALAVAGGQPLADSSSSA